MRTVQMETVGYGDDGRAIRRATGEDATAVVELFDEAIHWFSQIGNRGQWGTTPFSERPEQVQRVRGWCGEPGSWVAVDRDGEVGGALVLGEAQSYVPPAEVPEVYVRVLIASRRPGWRGTGRTLLQFADQEARAAGVGTLRVDCYAGGTGALVSFYESCEYVRTKTFTVGEWPGQILVRSLS